VKIPQQLPLHRVLVSIFSKINKRILSGLLAFTALFFSLGAWVYASPVGSDPDSSFHLATIWCAGGIKENICMNENIPAGETVSFVDVPLGVVLANGCAPGTPGQSANCMNDITASKDLVQTKNYDSYGLYPKGYYWAANKLVTENVTDSVIRIRFMNLFIFLFLVTSANLLLPKNLRRGLNVALLVCLVPLGLFLVTSTNPSSWSIAGNSTYWAFLYSFLTLEKSHKQKLCGVLALVSAGVAMLPRADSAAFIVLTSAVVILVCIARCTNLREQIYRRALLPAVVCIPAWNIFSGTVQGQAAFTGFMPGNLGRDHLATTLWNITRLPGLFAGIFGYPSAGGGLGWMDIAMPEIVVFGGLVVLGIVVSTFLVFRTYFEGIVITGFALLVCAIPLSILYRDTAIIGENFQSRYILPLVLQVIGLIVARGELTHRVSRPTKGLIVLLSTMGYLVALHTTIRRYVTGNDVMDWNLNRGKEWWWISALSPMTILWGSSICFFFIVMRVVFKDLEDEPISPVV
jgi:hypothetical protein